MPDGTMSGEFSFTGDAMTHAGPLAVAKGADQMEVSFAVPDLNAAAVIVLLSSVNLLLETNSKTTPQDTISLYAGQPLIHSSTLQQSPFSGPLTKLFLTEDDVAAGTFEAFVLFDATP